tara:strand:- start:70 stop:762 length:693 start_codon:yes stop_codon:yes gene_type:complete
MKFLCVIPARYGSKRVKFKNLKKINGKPLVYWTLNFADKIKKFDKIVISSDSKKITKIANQFKNIDQILRPTAIAKDNTDMTEVVNHVLDYYKRKNLFYDAVVILQPTSPFRKIQTINKAIKFFKKTKPDLVVSAIKVDAKSNSQNLFKLSKKKYTKNFKYNVGNNKNNEYKLDGGVVFIKKIKNRLSSIIDGNTIFIEVFFPEALDIDTEYDFEIAKLLMENEIEKNKN